MFIKIGGEAEEVSKLNLKNRGVKVRNYLAFLKNTKSTSLLIECCFVYDKDDVNVYNYKTMAKAIVEGILNKKINTDNTNVINTNNTKYKNCILYGKSIIKSKTFYNVNNAISNDDLMEVAKVLTSLQEHSLSDVIRIDSTTLGE